MEDVRKGILSSRSSANASCIRPRKHKITPENNEAFLIKLLLIIFKQEIFKSPNISFLMENSKLK